MKTCYSCKSTESTTNPFIGGRNNICKKCNSAKSRVYYKSNKRKVIIAANQWKKNNPERAKEIHLKHRYGISNLEYTKLLIEQNNACALCGRVNLKMVVDHDHNKSSIHIRSLLCFRCNNMLGMSGDDPSLLRKGAEYIERYKENIC